MTHSTAVEPAPLSQSSNGMEECEERPRERLLRHGARVLTDAELLAIVLRTGLPGCPVLELSRRLLSRFGGVRGLLGASPQQMLKTPGLGPAKASQLIAVLELTRRSFAEQMNRVPLLNRPELTQAYCQAQLAHQSVEVCLALYLDNRLRLIACEELSRGTLAQATIYPREVVRAALRHHAATVILAHNHPSGLAEPSTADKQLTRHLTQALALVDIRLADHIIVAGHVSVSMAARGEMA